MDKIFIKGLKINCIIGVLPHEREQEQDLIADLELEFPLREAALSGDLSKTIDYAKVADRVAAYAVKRQAELLESLAEELCALILKEFKPGTVTITLTKPAAVPNAAGSGIMVSRALGDR